MNERITKEVHPVRSKIIRLALIAFPVVLWVLSGIALLVSFHAPLVRRLLLLPRFVALIFDFLMLPFNSLQCLLFTAQRQRRPDRLPGGDAHSSGPLRGRTRSGSMIDMTPRRRPRALSTRRCRPPPNWRLLPGRKSGTIRLAGYS